MEILMCIIGLIVGSIVAYFVTRPKIMGTLRIYEPDEPGEKPYLFVELGAPIEEICKHKQVSFKISLK